MSPARRSRQWHQAGASSETWLSMDTIPIRTNSRVFGMAPDYCVPACHRKKLGVSQNLVAARPVAHSLDLPGPARTGRHRPPPSNSTLVSSLGYGTPVEMRQDETRPGDSAGHRRHTPPPQPGAPQTQLSRSVAKMGPRHSTRLVAFASGFSPRPSARCILARGLKYTDCEDSGGETTGKMLLLCHKQRFVEGCGLGRQIIPILRPTSITRT